MNKEKLVIVASMLEKERGWFLNASWSQALADTSKGEVFQHNNSFFENIYRAYHASFKVCHMQGYVGEFIGMLLYLHLTSIPVDVFTVSEAKYRQHFQYLTEKIFGDNIDIEKVILKESLTYDWLHTLYNCKSDNKGYWQRWEAHHLNLFGITYWFWAVSLSYVGINLALEDGNLDRGGIISYQEGIHNYVSGDINYIELEKLNRSIDKSIFKR